MALFRKILAAAAMAAPPILPCAGAIGEMGPYDIMAKEDVCNLPAVFCRGGSAIGSSLGQDEKYFYTNTPYNVLWNYPALFQSMMCQLQFFCEPDFDPFGYIMGLEDREFPGCATPAAREGAAKDLYPTLSNRNAAVSQLVPFFASGGTTNLGILTVGPLMHAYGGSPLCVWPASNVVDVTGGNAPLEPVPGATALKAGVGRGGCFDVVGWLSCTNAADRPQGFRTGKHPMDDLGTYLYESLSPHFDIDWYAKGIPTSTATTYQASYFLTNSPAYLSAEAVPTNATNPVLTIEPWRRSWEALGGLACVAWRLNANPFSYAVTNEYHMGVVSASSSNAVVTAITKFMEDGHPDIGNTAYFPSDGQGVSKNQFYNPPRHYNGVNVRPVFDYNPDCVFPIGYLQGDSPLDGIDITYAWSVSNSFAVTEAPISNRAMSAEIMLDASSVKRWRCRKVVDTNESWTSAQWTEVRDFGHGTHEYVAYTNSVITNAYHWVLDEEMEPETSVEYFAATNYLRSLVSATYPTPAAAAHEWIGVPSLSWHGRSISRASTVCRYDDAGAMSADYPVTYFMGGVDMGWLDEIMANAGRDPKEWGEPDAVSTSVYVYARSPAYKTATDGPLWWHSEWQGDGSDYTIKTAGPPPPYASTKPWTNVIYMAEYPTTNEWGDVTDWLNMVSVSFDGEIITDELVSWPPTPDNPPSSATGGYTPLDEAWAVSEIKFTVHNWLDIYYRVWWEPVRAWGVYSEVTDKADWPTN